VGSPPFTSRIVEMVAKEEEEEGEADLAVAHDSIHPYWSWSCWFFFKPRWLCIGGAISLVGGERFKGNWEVPLPF